MVPGTSSCGIVFVHDRLLSVHSTLAFRSVPQQVVKRSGLSPDFESERLVFDIVEPQEFVVGGDVSLSIEIWDDSAWSDDLLASVNLSALR